MAKVIFKFSGGPMDGKTVVGESGHDDEAHRYYALTYHGRVGQQFHLASDYAVDILTSGQLKEEASPRFQQHTYQVTDRIKNGDIVLILRRVPTTGSPSALTQDNSTRAAGGADSSAEGVRELGPKKPVSWPCHGEKSLTQRRHGAKPQRKMR